MSDVEDTEIQDTAVELFPPTSEKDPPREGWGENQSEVERMTNGCLLRIKTDDEYNDKMGLKLRYARGPGYPNLQAEPADSRGGKTQFINVRYP